MSFCLKRCPILFLFLFLFLFFLFLFLFLFLLIFLFLFLFLILFLFLFHFLFLFLFLLILLFFFLYLLATHLDFGIPLTTLTTSKIVTQFVKSKNNIMWLALNGLLNETAEKKYEHLRVERFILSTCFLCQQVTRFL